MCLQEAQVQLQHGVLRTNCIDCLDRTNVAQFAYGLAAMGQQLHGLGLADSPSVDAQSSAARELMDMYETMGNVLSRQVSCCHAYCVTCALKLGQSSNCKVQSSFSVSGYCSVF